MSVITNQATVDTVNAILAELRQAGRDGALIANGYYASEAAGRAAVADGDTFKVVGTGDTAALLYRRTSATVSELLARFPASAAVDALNELVKPGQRRAWNLTDDNGFLLAWLTELGGLHTPGYSIDSAGQGDTFRVVDRHGFVALDARKLQRRLVALEDRAAAVNAYPRFGGQLGALKEALCDPYQQLVGIVLAADSIGWGLSATGIAASTPRGHALTDARNNNTSPTWANLLHQYLGRHYMGKSAPDASANWAGSPSGACQSSYQQQVRVLPRAAELSGAWTRSANAGAALQKLLTTSTTTVADGGAYAFEFTGSSFSVLHQVRADGAPFEVLVDGVSLATYQTSTTALGVAAQFGYVRAVSLGSFRRRARIEIRAKAGAAAVLALEGLQVDRVLRVTNQGLIGTDSQEWADALFAAAVRSDDSFALIQLGTNDRLDTLGNATALRGNLEAIIGQAQARGIQPVLLCANATTDALAPHDAAQRAAIVLAGRSMGVDVIDQQPITRAAIERGDSILADGLHPNTAGHALMFGNFVRNLEHSNVY